MCYGYIFVLFVELWSNFNFLPAQGYSQYYAVAGGKISLPCNVSFSSEEGSVSLILWYRGDTGVPIYTFDLRRGPLKEARHFPSSDLGARAYFDTSSKIPNLNINPVQVEDEGDYKCRIDYRRSRTVNYNVRLKVIVPPKEIIISDENGERLRDVIGPYDEGTFLTLICESTGGIPSPSVTWWRGSSLLDDSYFNTSDGAVRNELLLPRLHRFDLMAVITCQASNTNLTSASTASVKMDLNLRPLNVRITTSYRPVSYGKKLTLVCESSGSRPPAHLTWWIEYKKLQSGRNTVSGDNNITTSTLTFQPSISDNGKYVSCRAENPKLRNSAIEDRWTLNIYYAPILHLVFGAKIQKRTIREGSDVYFECNIKANPWVTEVGWTFKGQPLFSNTTAGIIVSNQSLVLQKIRRENRGSYRCTATNSEGEGISDELSLQVQFAPVCKPGQKILYGIARDELMNITCEVEADPEDVTFHWALNNTIENIKINNFTSNGTISILRYTPRKMLGYGALQCWASNSIGTQKTPCIIRIIPAGPPESLRDCVVTNQTFDSVKVECQAGYDGGLKQQFHLDVYNSAIKYLQANLTATDVPIFTVQDLPRGTTFVLLLYAKNAKGQSNFVTLTATTLSPAARRSASSEASGVTPILGVLIGVVGALVIIAVVVIVVMKLQSNDSDKGSSKKNSEKRTTPLKQDTDDNQETTKDPDIIPPKNDFLDTMDGHIKKTTIITAGDQTLKAVNRKNYRTKKKEDGVTYAELSLPCQEHFPPPKSNNVHCTQYAELDFSNHTVIPISRREFDEKRRSSFEKPLIGQVIQAPKTKRRSSNKHISTPL
ncbi:protein turtle-like isoform X2 [Centruroides vittatus]|uniref:protein turtle-like isoform X2 n=1 Tax=Centruroides vittatus TaxID=120091 RepID=UPI00350F9889